MNKWEKMVSTRRGSCEVDVWLDLEHLAGDVISRTLFGSSYEEGKNVLHLMKELVELTIQTIKFVYIPGQRYPEWQKRARDEVSQVFRNTKPDFDGINRLKIVFSDFIDERELIDFPLRGGWTSGRDPPVCRGFVFARKLKQLKEDLKKRNRDVFGNRVVKKATIMQDIQQLDVNEQHD
ncbi:hypothetical protein F0562_009056 [Nyssa sinensis]|uniref:Uncharacterized protein n=1 Tax=Nyssa sinensis TaxID=561372 RepID=A0A5J5A6H6_9ASTE|nr:hypothetical protein F0562_009056 [Nyssa sinensis]